MNKILLYLYFLISLFSYQSLVSQNQTKTSILKSIIDSVKTTTIPTSNKIALLEKTIPLSDNEIETMEALGMLGKAYYNIELYDKAYNYFTKALDIAESKKEVNRIGWYYMKLGSIQLRIKNFEKALELYEKALSHFKLSNDSELMMLVKGNIAVVQSKIGPIKSAVRTLEEMVNDSTISNKNKSTTLMTLGNIYLEKLAIPKEAIKYYQKSLTYGELIEDTTLQIMNLQNIAESYLSLNDYSNAYDYNKKSETILIKHPNLELNTTLYLFYAKIAEAKNEYHKAYNYLELHHQYNDSIINANNLLKITRLETTKEIEKHKADLAIQTNKVDLLEHEKYISTLKTTILLISIVLVFIITYWIVKRASGKIKILKTEKSVVEDKLDFNKDKIQKMALNITTSQEYISSFSEKIKTTLSQISDKKSKEKLNELLREIQSYKIINEHKRDFKAYLNKVSDDYLYQLNQKYPGLTSEEQHLCSLIHLNLKNKDIASLLNLSVRSVENKRYRIRKKMNLDSNDNLTDLLNNL